MMQQEHSEGWWVFYHYIKNEREEAPLRISHVPQSTRHSLWLIAFSTFLHHQPGALSSPLSLTWDFHSYFVQPKRDKGMHFSAFQWRSGRHWPLCRSTFLPFAKAEEHMPRLLLWEKSGAENIYTHFMQYPSSLFFMPHFPQNVTEPVVLLNHSSAYLLPPATNWGTHSSLNCNSCNRNRNVIQGM